MSDLAETMHTAGPWVVETPMGDECPWIVEAGKQPWERRCIAQVPAEDPVNDEDKDPVAPISIQEAMANARLIAAAPAMLKALEEIERCIHPSVGGALGAIRKHALAAIAAAKGATP